MREFDRLFHTLADDQAGLTTKELDDRVHRVMVRIQANLDNLYRITERTIPKAEAGSALGGRIIESVSWEVDRLERASRLNQDGNTLGSRRSDSSEGNTNHPNLMSCTTTWRFRN